MLRSISFSLLVAAAAGLAGCSSDYSPNTYSASAVQQANKVEPAVVVGFRQVAISANGTVGAVSGGAAGGILGAQVGSGGMNSALGTVGGTAIGSLLGTAMEHIAGDTNGWEYIVRKPNAELLSVTQKEPKPLPIGQKVLVITGNQARIVPDYSTPLDPTAAEQAKADVAKGAPVKVEPLTLEEAAPAATPAPSALAPAPPPEPPKPGVDVEPLPPPAGAGVPPTAAPSTAPAAPPAVTSPAAIPAPAAAGDAAAAGGGSEARAAD
ncbi:glycine zipper 2TM domain-containing protein [Azospirillum picis]|uniref:17 kDa surface antigen n=1 Tax=Azospirillum picis TaxID=488438 RepID=A0ABU0MT67_9PROT|nr:glycine zipper 2TM domain-containing protein [Azospirillum picis]MBP2302853.1 outer membrane lipoprotein SlyB [Azospirillum picis]MDQ0536642.1 outer membrane lipoprotein SlyB [Azospirillum picis]